MVDRSRSRSPPRLPLREEQHNGGKDGKGGGKADRGDTGKGGTSEAQGKGRKGAEGTKGGKSFDVSLLGAWETGRLGRSWQDVLSPDAISHLDAWTFGVLGHSWEEFQEIPRANPGRISRVLRGFDPVNLD
jgi:hypothetical protein